MKMRSLVSASVMSLDYGRQIAPGEIVDLDVRLPNGTTLRDHVRPEWFEAIAEPAKKQKQSDEGVIDG